MNLHDRDITRAAKIEGAAEAKLEAARNLLSMKLGSAEQIAQVVGLSQEKILELQKETHQ